MVVGRQCDDGAHVLQAVALRGGPERLLIPLSPDVGALHRRLEAHALLHEELELQEPSPLKEQAAEDRDTLEGRREQDFVQHLEGGLQGALREAVEEREGVLFLAVVDELLHGLQGDRRARAVEERELLALRAKVPGVALHHVEEVLGGLLVDAHGSTAEEAHDPAHLLPRQELPEDLALRLRHELAQTMGLVSSAQERGGGEQEEGDVRRRGGEVGAETVHVGLAELLDVGDLGHAVRGKKVPGRQAVQESTQIRLRGIVPDEIGARPFAFGDALDQGIEKRGLLPLLGTEEEVDALPIRHSGGPGRRVSRGPSRSG